ncbi:DUF2254 domain-containing protein [Nocardioides marinus]|uniref:Putative membrane protein n=1 Tax=Nocardioides marinus TaxID=374514 RepID=A0A7Y9YH16_9ACTN|nr:DUF2254 domain-containing protein [Nocardioides marinus]NYI10922.1 putative membrane protein [Nocardioides marinus]
MQPTVVPLPVSAVSSLGGWRASRPVRRLAAVLRPFWVVPATWCLMALGLGLALPYVELTWLVDRVPLLFPGGVDGARSVLSTIAGAMISVTGLVFSITMVVLQLAASQYSPRVLRTFLEDRLTQHTLGAFAASFVYALTVLRSVDGTVERAAEGQDVPQLGVSLAYVLVLVAVAMFLAFIHRITTSVGVASILQRTARDCRALLDEGQHSGWPVERPALPDLPGPHVLVAPRSGYLDRIDVIPLVRAARAQEARVEVLVPLGDFVVEGSPLLAVHGRPAQDPESLLCRVSLVADRSMEQDVGYGVRRLVDVAERALSPGVNDPTTAVQVLDQLHDLLRRMLTAPGTWPVRLDEEGVPRLVLRSPATDEAVREALSDIAHWGAEHRRVRERVERVLAELRVSALPEHRAALDL